MNSGVMDQPFGLEVSFARQTPFFQADSTVERMLIMKSWSTHFFVQYSYLSKEGFYQNS